MIGGFIPAECVVFSLLVLELGWRELENLRDLFY
jgi:hypothetical protein